MIRSPARAGAPQVWLDPGDPSMRRHGCGPLLPQPGRPGSVIRRRAGWRGWF